MSKQQTKGPSDEIEQQRFTLERDRLRFDRKKAAMEFRLKRLELVRGRGKEWKELIASPFTLAVVGGFIGVMTTIVANHLNASANLALEATKAQLQANGEAAKADSAAHAAKQTLQADLIKKFVESPKTDTVRENLRFLIDAGLLPDYASKIQTYLSSNPNAAPQVGSSPQSPSVVVGGATASKQNWPWLIGLTMRKDDGSTFLFCQGTLLGPRLVLTDAVCASAAERFKWGGIEAVTLKDAQGSANHVQVSRFYQHPSFVSATSENDIGLAELKEPLPPPYVTISYARRSDPAPNTLAIVAAMTPTQSELLEAKLPIADEETCRKAYGSRVDPARNICAGFASGGADSCQGAGGGPLVVFDQSGRKYQVGITSWGEGCGTPGRYGVYTRISAFSDWIKKTVPDLLPANTGPELLPDSNGIVVPHADATYK